MKPKTEIKEFTLNNLHLRGEIKPLKQHWEIIDGKRVRVIDDFEIIRLYVEGEKEEND